jgi:hypothetical protein
MSLALLQIQTPTPKIANLHRQLITGELSASYKLPDSNTKTGDSVTASAATGLESAA